MRSWRSWVCLSITVYIFVASVNILTLVLTIESGLLGGTEPEGDDMMEIRKEKFYTEGPPQLQAARMQVPDQFAWCPI